jgi:CW-type Zinc Finger
MLGGLLAGTFWHGRFWWDNGVMTVKTVMTVLPSPAADAAASVNWHRRMWPFTLTVAAAVQVAAAELRLLAGWLRAVEATPAADGSDLPWVACEACERWRLLTPKAKAAFERSGHYTCADAERPVKGCQAGLNDAFDDEALLQKARDELGLA